ncbi:uncharacterized protein LOC125859251 [Solanum stenotomum]|uniref:uncharacterized protein LOC125859251 n=1 Tax=Solanum stenotomum TaxID=172797 RepID=UPI0020D01CDA|nr:uncharacterized protein LOC125859251 [Solanum stenotomum]
MGAANITTEAKANENNENQNDNPVTIVEFEAKASGNSSPTDGASVLNQELGLARAGDTRWGSHYKSFNNFILMFGPSIDVFDDLVVNARFEEKCWTKGYLTTFDLRFQLEETLLVLARDDDKRFFSLKRLANLFKIHIEKKKHETYLLVVRLVKFALLLLVATAIVERHFSAMKLIKTDLRN